MAITTLCAVVAALRVLPNRSQFFQYESVSLSCEQPGDSSDWRVKMNTSSQINQDCVRDGFPSWNETTESGCLIPDLYPSDTGVYWCESAAGGCSDAVSITVTGGPVILEGPALPVMEGDAVTLSCRNQKTPSSNLTSDFYKDGRLIGSSSTGNLSIHRVSQSDEGLYRCNISGAGESLHSRLTVRAGPLHPPLPVLTPVLLPVVTACLSLLSVMLLCLWRRLKGKVDPDIFYTDVVITPVHPKRSTDVNAAPTIYSTVKPGNT
ncbi:high affinity immunoglobulin gamma Fc receptor I-like [Pempheris klunzingeri]|uniref:high affinity immunoglobulin gamma Fc receptor I-like n=1 Tax=Pempheris klunzingeri TaxID=3127111 RepID=UPI00398035A0